MKLSKVKAFGKEVVEIFSVDKPSESKKAYAWSYKNDAASCAKFAC